MEDYKNYTRLEIAAIVAIHEAINGDRKYLHNIITDTASTYDLNDDEKDTLKKIVIEELIDLEDMTRDELLELYESTIDVLSYVLFELKEGKNIYIEKNPLYLVLKNEIKRRMK